MGKFFRIVSKYLIGVEWNLLATYKKSLKVWKH